MRRYAKIERNRTIRCGMLGGDWREDSADNEGVQLIKKAT